MTTVPKSFSGYLNRLMQALIAATLACVITIACEDQNVVTKEILERAEDYRANGDFSASNIEAKNVLQIDPDNQDARFLIGSNLLDMGAWALAEISLERAYKTEGTLQFGILRKLLRAKLALRKHDEAIELARLDPKMTVKLQAEIQVLMGQALIGINKPKEGRQAFEQALKTDPESFEAYLGLAGLFIKDDESAKADEYFQKASAIAPNDVATLLFKGQLNTFKKNYEISETAYTALLKLRPTRLDFQLNLVEVLIAQEKYKEAVDKVDAVLKRAPKLPRANYLRAYAALRLLDYRTAVVNSQTVLSIVPQHGPSNLILGIGSYMVGNFEQASRAAGFYLEHNPSNAAAQRLLAAAQLRQKRPKDAANTLEKLAATEKNNESIQWITGQALNLSGELEKSSTYFQRVIELRPENTHARAALGATMLALGDSETGIRELNRAIKADPAIPQADILLIRNLLKNKKYDEVLAAAKRLQENHPNKPNGFSAAGAAYIAKGNMAAAREAFEKALKIRPGTPDAATNLAQMELAEKNPEKARELLVKVLQHHPKHLRTLSILGKLDITLKNHPAAIGWLEKALEIRPNALTPALTLSRLLLQEGDHRKALLVAQRTIRYYPNQEGLLEVIGKAQIATWDLREARDTFLELVRARPESADARLMLGDAYFAMGDLDNARKIIEGAIAINPANLNAKAGLADILLRQNKLEPAGKIIAELQEKVGDKPITLRLAGDLAAKEGRSEDAMKFYMRARKLSPTGKLVEHMANTLVQAQNFSKAKKIMVEWLKSDSSNPNIRFKLASLHLLLGETAAAKSEFLILAEQNPKNWLFANNLAGTLQSLKEYDDALSYAQKAYRMAPNQPVVIDTYGMLLLELGKNEQAVQLMRLAVKKAPDNLLFAFNLAKALSQSGQEEEARAILTRILDDGKDTKILNSAEILLEKLGG